MCVILDTNRFSDALSNPPGAAYAPLLDWLLSGNGVVVLGGRKYREEISNHGAAQRFFAKLIQAGRAKSLPDAAVDEECARICSLRCCASDDEHIVALALVSGARVICTEDHALMQDIRTAAIVSRPRGRIYRTVRHRHLLHHDSGCQAPPER